tara:strand:- start:189 stop:506 length:318 start_codon:yes stop_codon:yes gene_type:complete
MDNMNALVQAMSALRPSEPMHYNSGEPIDASKIVYESECEAITQTELDAKISELQTAYVSQAYARSRKAEYPPWEEQLDHIYHNGVASWKANMVKPVKDKFPKPA